MNWMDSRRRLDKGVTAELQDELFAFCGGSGAACVDLLNRVFSTNLIGFLLSVNCTTMNNKRRNSY